MYQKSWTPGVLQSLIFKGRGESRAAEMMHVTQPALSMQIRALEDEIGSPVVERTPSGVVLTPQGRALELHARRVMAAMAGLDQAMRELTRKH